MSWKPIDFQGIISLDRPIIDLLTNFLDDKESELAKAILNIIPLPAHSPSSQIPLEEDQIKLTYALEIFEKRDYHFPNHGKPIQETADLKEIAASLNKVLWHYVEILEGCTTELFIQLEQISLEQWHERLADVVGSLKELLVHRMEDLIWAIRRLEKQLWKFHLDSKSLSPWGDRWASLSHFWSSLLDKELVSNLIKSQEFLRDQHQKFMKRYRGYLKLEGQVQPFIDKLKNYRALNHMERELEKMIMKFFLLLKLWEMNRQEKSLPSQEFVTALNNMLSIDRGTALLKEYYKLLRGYLFDISLHLKTKAEELEDPTAKAALLEEVTGYHNEAKTLELMLANYRSFLLRANPDPYVRTRLGYSEETVGAEPSYTKPLLTLGYDVEGLAELYEQLIQSLKRTDHSHVRQESVKIDTEVQQALHEMGHPLASYRLLRSKAEFLLDKLKQLDELGSMELDIIDYFSNVLAKLMRYDWKYSVLPGIPLFHQLYAIHQGLVPPVEDRSHANRLAKCSLLLQQISDWVKAQQIQIHAHDIELDMNDIKGYLQDFLGSVQRITSEQNLTTEQLNSHFDEISEQLLEFRYLFGAFFYKLRQNESEGYYIRRQFLFVDQYFETVESKLYELHSRETPLEQE